MSKKKTEVSLVRSSAAEYLTFVAASGSGGVEAVYADENVWLSQKMMATLYDVNVRTANEHLKKIFADHELLEESVIRKFRITAPDGKNYNTLHYNLSAIIAVGYKVNSERAVQFRKWATGIIESFTIKGFAMDDDPALRDWQSSGARKTAKGRPQRERGGVHQYGVPPKTAMRGSAIFQTEGSLRVVSEAKNNNANFAWVQHFIHHLAPHGMAGFDFVHLRYASVVLANGSMSSNQSGDCNSRRARRNWATNSQGLGSQREIRQKLIEADLVDCMVALPGQLFYSTQIPVCLWFLAKNKNADAKRRFRERSRLTSNGKNDATKWSHSRKAGSSDRNQSSFSSLMVAEAHARNSPISENEKVRL